MSTQQNDNEGIWIRTAPDTDGTYRVSLELSDDIAEFLDPATAMRHAQYVLTQVCRAEFDAKVVKQFDSLLPPVRPGGSADDRAATIALMIRDLRKLRIEPIPPTRLSIRPGVNQTREPFLTVLIDDDAVGQWSIDDGRSHAGGVIEAVEAADLDNQYLQVLTKSVELTDEMARRVISNLA